MVSQTIPDGRPFRRRSVSFCVRLWTNGWTVRICLVPELWLSPSACMVWVNKGIGSPAVSACATGHIKDPLPLIEKSRASCPRWSVSSYSFIHQVIIITGLNKLVIQLYVLALKMPSGRRPITPLKFLVWTRRGSRCCWCSA